MSTRKANAKPNKTMNPEDQTPQAPLQSPVENGATDIDVGLGGDAARIAELEAKVSELTDAHLRAKAETENARRRADEEVAKARKFGVEPAQAQETGRPTKRDRRDLVDWQRWSASVDDDH